VAVELNVGFQRSFAEARVSKGLIAEQPRFAVGYSGGINEGGRHSSYSTNIGVSAGAQALVSGAPLHRRRFEPIRRAKSASVTMCDQLGACRSRRYGALPS
jgi:hypothetical protein